LSYTYTDAFWSNENFHIEQFHGHSENAKKIDLYCFQSDRENALYGSSGGQQNSRWTENWPFFSRWTEKPPCNCSFVDMSTKLPWFEFLTAVKL
jgi:hypothetical protein